jgi:CBS domain-containing protein
MLLSPPLPSRDAVHKMLDANVAGAPVVNDKGQLIGILSEADIIWKVCRPSLLVRCMPQRCPQNRQQRNQHR